jgi:transposase
MQVLFVTLVTTGTMPVPISGDNFAHRYAVVADTRRRWSDDEKQAIIAEALQPGVNVSAVARRHGITPNLLFRWRKAAQIEAKPTAPAFLPVSVSAPTKSGETGCDRNDSEAPAADNRIEIELLNGRRVRVGPGADMGALKRILDIADGRRS